MKFTYEGYGDLIDSLKNNGYGFADYENYRQFEKCVILRHDVDYDLQRVIKMAELEHEKNVSATYFVLLTSDFYNLASKESEEVLKYLKKSVTILDCILTKRDMIFLLKNGKRKI